MLPGECVGKVVGGGAALYLGPMAAATNPGGMAFVGKQYDLSLSILNPSRRYTVTGGPSMISGTFGLAPGTYESKSPVFYIPTISANWLLNDEETMGVVAGGDFKKLINQKYKIKKGTVAATGQAIDLGIQEKTRTWGLKLVYQVYMPAHKVYVLGVSGSPMDTKSFQIVKGGQNEERKEFACPGLSHTGTYPVEIVVYTDGAGEIRVAMIDAMYRMKIYFEDAGTTAFMKNMKMPGSIEKEITKHIKMGFEK